MGGGGGNKNVLSIKETMSNINPIISDMGKLLLIDKEPVQIRVLVLLRIGQLVIIGNSSGTLLDDDMASSERDFSSIITFGYIRLCQSA